MFLSSIYACAHMSVSERIKGSLFFSIFAFFHCFFQVLHISQKRGEMRPFWGQLLSSRTLFTCWLLGERRRKGRSSTKKKTQESKKKVSPMYGIRQMLTPVLVGNKNCAQKKSVPTYRWNFSLHASYGNKSVSQQFGATISRSRRKVPCTFR